MSGSDILQLPYEALVADQEGWTRTLREFVGLPWDEACLRYHECDRVATTLSNDQVRQATITSSIERWKRTKGTSRRRARCSKERDGPKCARH